MRCNDPHACIGGEVIRLRAIEILGGVDPVIEEQVAKAMGWNDDALKV
jgi:hypothetical protein